LQQPAAATEGGGGCNGFGGGNGAAVAVSGAAQREGKLNPNWSGSTISTNCGVGPTSLTGDARTRFVPTLPRQHYSGVGMSARLSICLKLSFSAFGKKPGKIWWDFVPQT
jgi:hypothetical protein